MGFFSKLTVLIMAVWTMPYAGRAAKVQVADVGLSELQEGRQTEIRLLKELCDSLALTDNFEGIIALAQMYVTDPDYTSVVVPYMVPAYYFTGDTVKSKSLLLKTIQDKTYLQMTTAYLTSSNYALIKYFNIEKNREPIITRVLDKYKNAVKCTHPEAGQQILRFFINDQRIRKLKQAYSKSDSVMQKRIRQYQLKEDSIQNANIYTFYRQQGKYLDEKEVGAEVSSMQLICFAHINGAKLRQTFYQPLLEKALKEGVIAKENLVNFILRTESLTNKDFFKTINERMPEIRKQYNLPDSYIFTPF